MLAAGVVMGARVFSQHDALHGIVHKVAADTIGNCAASIGFLTSVDSFEKPLKEPQLPSAK
jgi:hypothetical protein